MRGERHNLQLQRAEVAVNGQDKRTGLALRGHPMVPNGDSEGAGDSGGVFGLQTLHAMIVSIIIYFQKHDESSPQLVP